MTSIDWEKYSGSKKLIIFMIIVGISMLTSYFYLGSLFLLILGSFIGILYTFSFFRLKKLQIKGKRLSYNSVIRKDFEFWSVDLSSVEKVEVFYLSDTGSNLKHLCFYLKNGQKRRAKIIGVYMMDFNNLFSRYFIKSYISYNNRYIPYDSKGYKT